MNPERLIIRDGCVLTLDPAIGDFRKADVLIEGSKIVQIAPEIQADDCEIIDAAGMVVMPGFVDGHKHTWQTVLRGSVVDLTLTQFFGEVVPAVAPRFTPDDVYASNLLGAVDALNGGITTLLDWCHITLTPEHTRAAVRGLKDSGVRAWFAHAPALLNWGDPTADHPADIRALQREEFSGSGQLVQLALAARGPAWTDEEATRKEFQLARDLGIPISVHVQMTGYPPGEVRKLHEAGLLGPDVTLLHGNSLTDEDIELARATGCKFVDSATCDIAMGIGPALHGRLLDAGIRPALSPDSPASLTTDMFFVMRSVLLLERARVYQRLWDNEGQVETPYLSTRDLLEMATVEGANACWLADKVGTITPGKEADIILIRGLDWNVLPLSNVIAGIVANATASNVDTVLVGGKVVKRHGEMVSVDAARVRRLVLEARDRLYEAVASSEQRTPLFVLYPPKA
jgi:cytosine/adenosine deaminase-related metal-dependent hydrolase